ncbi:MAG TPA: PepSY domain-containing protein [Gemmatimonadaceae bacterium]|nr:PepSY domain-containing protein [Gemmatimonadaceae bacterium]
MTRSIKQTLVAAGVIAGAAFTTLAAQGPVPKYKRDLPARFVKQATVAEADAARTAAARVPAGRIQAVELEDEGGRLIYSYEIKVPGRSGIEEINVNAKTGEVVNTEHETPASERGEAKAEKAEKAEKAAKKPAK